MVLLGLWQQLRLIFLIVKDMGYYDGYSIEADTTYEINIINLGTKWVVAYSIVDVPQTV